MIVATFGGQPDRSYSRLTAQASAMLAAERDERGKTPILVIDFTDRSCPVLDVRPACVPGRRGLVYRPGPGRRSCSGGRYGGQVARQVVVGELRVQQIDEEGRAAVVDDRVAGGDGACGGGPVLAAA